MSNNAKRMVANEICNMLYNNVCEGNSVEPFTGWCEDGDLFSDDYNSWDGLTLPLNNKDKRDAVHLMREIAPLVDQISDILKHEHNE